MKSKTVHTKNALQFLQHFLGRDLRFHIHKARAKVENNYARIGPKLELVQAPKHNREYFEFQLQKKPQVRGTFQNIFGY